MFDLDGTLIDSQADLANAVNAALVHCGRAELAPHTIAGYVGDGAPMLIRRALGDGANDAERERALAYFLDYYRDHSIDHTRLYPGVREAMDRFLGAGRKLAVLTNKPVRISELILDGLGLGGYFLRVYGGNSFAEKKPHPVGLESLMTEFGSERHQTAMIGDSAVDVLTARNARVLACGVRYGFRPESFREHPPDLLIDGMIELASAILD